MKANEFDKAVRHSYEQGSFDYDPAHWDNMVQQLNEAESKRKSLAWLPLLGYAASIVFMVSIGAFLMRTNAPQDKLADNKSWHEQGMIFTQPHAKQELAWQNNANNATGAPQAVQNTPYNKTSISPREIVMQAQSPAIAIAIPADENMLNASIGQVQVARQVVVTHKAPKYIDFNNYAYEPVNERRTLKTIISVTGGFNYGSANSGYSMGFTARQKLGENVFFEGDIAFVNNVSGKKSEYITEGDASSYAAASSAAASAQSAYLGGNAGKTIAAKPSNTAARPSGTTDPNEPTPAPNMPAPPKGSHYNMYYAQVTPTLGYNVFKNLSLSGGADVQRLLQGDKLMTVTQNVVDAKYLPSYDLGFVGKSEYAISKQIKATVYYRHGLNNAVSGTDKYIDRNYIQFQLKFSILNR